MSRTPLPLGWTLLIILVSIIITGLYTVWWIRQRSRSFTSADNFWSVSHLPTLSAKNDDREAEKSKSDQPPPYEALFEEHSFPPPYVCVALCDNSNL